MLLTKARNDVMFAHYAVRRNIIHAVNITDEVNITCPQGQTSFQTICLIQQTAVWRVGDH